MICWVEVCDDRVSEACGFEGMSLCEVEMGRLMDLDGIVGVVG